MRDGNEPNQSNTLNNCTDGNNGSYHSDESVDKIVVSQSYGNPNDMTEGDTVTITATVWCYGNGTSDYVDFYHASDVSNSNPVWIQIGERQQCPGGGEQTITAEYTLPEVGEGDGMQVVRVNLIYGNNTAGVDSCVTNEFDDTDDLIISVMPKPTTVPSLSPSSPPSNQPSTSAAPSSLPSYYPSEAPSTSAKPSMSSSNAPSSLSSMQPSSIPSHSPSGNPSKAPVLTKTLVCGRGDFPDNPCDEGLESTAAIDTVHEVRCCRDCTGINCKKQKPWKRKCADYDPNLFALSKYDGVCKSGTFEEALDFCRSITGDNTRLCTRDEMKNSCTKGTGCKFDEELIWSCAPDGHTCSSDTECCGSCNTVSGICENEFVLFPLQSTSSKGEVVPHRLRQRQRDGVSNSK